jgi:hypothetical protein
MRAPEENKTHPEHSVRLSLRQCCKRVTSSALLVAAVLAAAPAIQAGNQIMLNEPALFQEPLQRESTVTEIPFEITVSAGRLQVQLRAQLPGTKASLIDPSGRIAVSSSDPGIIIQQRKITQQTELGDLLILPELPDPQAGRWRLHLTHPPAKGDEVATVTVSLYERFLLSIISHAERPTVGQPITLNVLASDNGQHLTGLSPRIHIMLDGVLIDTPLIARESATAPSGILLTTEAGNHLATYTPSKPGTYRFSTDIEFATDKSKVLKTAETSVEVSSGLISLQRIEASPLYARGDCIKTIEFQVDLYTGMPGSYTLSMFLAGANGQDLELSATKVSQGGHVHFTIPLSLKQARRRLENSSIELVKQIDVLLFDELGITLVGRYADLPIAPPVQLDSLCE